MILDVNSNVFDLWTFHMLEESPRYLLLKASEKKAEEWYNGAQLWQAPGGLLPEAVEIGTVDILQGLLEHFGLWAKALWTVEQTYTKYNRHRDCIEIVPVFAAFVDKPETIPLTWHHEEYRWASAEEALELVRMPGLVKGLEWVREAVTEVEMQRPELRML